MAGVEDSVFEKWQEEINTGFRERNKYAVAKEFKDHETFEAKPMVGVMEGMARKLDEVSDDMKELKKENKELKSKVTMLTEKNKVLSDKLDKIISLIGNGGGVMSKSTNDEEVFNNTLDDNEGEMLNIDGTENNAPKPGHYTNFAEIMKSLKGKNIEAVFNTYFSKDVAKVYRDSSEKDTKSPLYKSQAAKMAEYRKVVLYMLSLTNDFLGDRPSTPSDQINWEIEVSKNAALLEEKARRVFSEYEIELKGKNKQKLAIHTFLNEFEKLFTTGKIEFSIPTVIPRDHDLIKCYRNKNIPLKFHGLDGENV